MLKARQSNQRSHARFIRKEKNKILEKAADWVIHNKSSIPSGLRQFNLVENLESTLRVRVLERRALIENLKRPSQDEHGVSPNKRREIEVTTARAEMDSRKVNFTMSCSPSPPQMLTPTEEEELVRLMNAFCKCGGALTRMMVQEHILLMLKLRKANNKSGRTSIPFSESAKRFLQQAESGVPADLSVHFWQRFEDDHPELQLSRPSTWPISVQRLANSTYANFQLLQERRLAAVTALGILDPETNQIDTSRILNIDECPNQLDGTPKGNNVSMVYGNVRFDSGLL